ncbi:MAG TPA: ATP-dependent DNA helicase [Desulfobulbus sp.]|nr:ATP-dependent DNA helicase [Desulfobulbus sp.]
MERIFAEDGLLSRHLPGYEPRPGQQEMAAAVADLLATDTGESPGPAACLVVEAETGLGKTLAYLVPAVLSGRRVVISTNTRNLQDQIIRRDIPLLRRILDPDLAALCVKGRQNYLCLYRWHQVRAAASEALLEGLDIERLEQWMAETEFGDRAELPWLPSASGLWQKICCQSHSCPGSECPHATACFLNRLRRRAAACRLLVVNHHLLFSDLAVRRGGYGEVLPRYEAIIFDEAHHVEDVATTFFGQSVSRHQVLDLVGDIERSTGELPASRQEEILAPVHGLRSTLERFTNLFPAEPGRFLLRELMAQKPEIGRCRDDLVTALHRLADILAERTDNGQPWEQFAGRGRELADRLAAITAESFADLPAEEIRSVQWFERSRRNLVLSSTPVDVTNELQETLFSSVAACVFTSATLGVGGSFSYFLHRLGLPDDTPALSFPSPFNYRDNALLYVPEDSFPAPASPEHRRRLHRRIRRLVSLAGGRTLLLFTSLQAMEAAFHALEDELDFTLLRQGSMPRHELLTRFMEETSSVLFAVASFWEGIDIPGESLGLVIIDKLPFEVPGDPVIMARINHIKAEGGNPFFEFQVPRAILTLRQGAGRLLRSSGDRGVIAILDVRLFSKGYGRRFLKSLPPSPLTRDLDTVAAFFSADREPAGAEQG